jgi:hypothetical protein
MTPRIQHGAIAAMSIADIVAELYKEQPQKPLFHYTSLGGLMGIVESAAIRCTEMRYLSDSAELEHAVELMEWAIGSRFEYEPQKKDKPPLTAIEAQVLKQLQGWLRHSLLKGHGLFVACFTENGNLLSQWRSYTQPGRGAFERVCHPSGISACALRLRCTPEVRSGGTRCPVDCGLGRGAW